ncbi:hypothetical protein GKE82_25080 [Conexibacter sp. W3-3-2]|uniref:hypothetical protein n=1 Tax=Conexibacter sp. W3-3-2 TaxID=2675227 RepID=UPI0012B7D424|nr:hypothetical protein [Conexibacter sp. W3-3-2]MTD47480.1 hypothetical protein [Conexibacter sp. W3-3-2]
MPSPDPPDDPLAGLPTNFVLGMERAMRLLEEIAAGKDVVVAIAERRRALDELLDGVDTVHALGALIRSEVALDPESYSESETPGSSYVVEMTAAALLARSARAPNGARVLDGAFTTQVREVTGDACFLESLRRALGAGSPVSGVSAARGRAAAQDLMLRAPGWVWQEHETLRGLFGEERFEARLRAEVGLGVDEAIACADGWVVEAGGWAADRLANALADDRAFGPGHPVYDWADSHVGGPWRDQPIEQQAQFLPMVWAWSTEGEALVLTPERLASASGVSVEHARCYLEALSLKLGEATDIDWFQATDMVRWKPFIDLGGGEYMPTVPGNDLWALRSLFESVVKGKSYAKHRGSWLEQRAAGLLAGVLRPTQDVRNAYIVDATGSRIGEVDAILQLDDTVICVEAKSATMRPSARRGGDALRGFLAENFTKAVEQSARARAAVLDGRLVDEAGRPIALAGHVREVHTVAVTLDDLSAVAPVVWQLEGTELLAAGSAPPWVLTLHELEQVCATTEWPAQLILFLRRRARLNELARHLASDELDWWMHFLNRGLYFEDEDAAARVRFASLTGPLDAWMLYERGLRETPAPKSRMPLDDRSRAALTRLDARRPDGWMLASVALMSGAGTAMADIWDAIEEAVPRAQSRQKVQRLRFEFQDHPWPIVLVAMVVPDQGRYELGAHLDDALAQRVAESPDVDVVVLGFLHDTTVRSIRVARAQTTD